ncbi:MAG TPA: helix-hairpin-helix domain-containing protein, partial [Candidatus Krumholzibacterium sp.]|nr:helix-hairpin-helix domain-containing protein [Candidatus Krumholzibacterium sp.]
AKRNEEIYRYGEKEVLTLRKSDGVLKLLQRMRDEAHRFAIEYHRSLRSRDLRISWLDGLEGIGEKRKLRLLVEFGSLKALKAASLEEIASIPGFGRKMAARILEGVADER